MSSSKQAIGQGSQPQKSTDWKLFVRVLHYFKPYTGLCILAVLASVLVSAATAGSAWLIKPALDQIFIEKNTQALLYVPLAFIALTFFKGLGRYVQNWAMNYSAMRVLETLRQELFHKIVGLPVRFYEETNIGVLMARILNDVMMIRQSLPAFVQLVRQVLTMVGLLAVVFQQNAHLALQAFVVLPLAGLPFIWFSRKLRKYGRRSAEISADISGMLQELLSGIRVIKAFATENQETQRFDKENARIVNLAIRQSNVSELSSPVMELIGALGIGGVIWVGGMEVIHGDMTPGTFFSFIAALVMLYDPIKAINAANMNIQNALAGAERVFDILDDPKLGSEHGGSLAFDEPLNSIEFDKVTLNYNEQNAPALDGVSLHVNAGERIALVGPSGAGKTSLVNLIPCFYRASQGQVRINGTPLEEYNLHSLRQRIAVVSQESFLFDMSIAENIAYGHREEDPVRLEQRIREAANAAYADSFIDQLPEGYATRVGERGVKLSGGQKQRLTIARALLKNASILVLDEATSALDSESEKMVQKALDNLMQGRTSFVIAHRLSTILEADRIVVMDRGRILDAGRHEELLKRCELYARLYAMQFGGAVEAS